MTLVNAAFLEAVVNYSAGRLEAAFEGTPSGWAEDRLGRSAVAVRELAEAANHGRGILGDKDLRPEAARARAAAVVAPFAKAARDSASGNLETLRATVPRIEQEAIATAAWRAESPVAEVARQASVDRALRHLESLSPAARIAFVVERARAGDGLPLAALEAAGYYGPELPADAMLAARRGWIEVARPEVAARLRQAEAQLAAMSELEAVVGIFVNRVESELGRPEPARAQPAAA